MPQKAIDVQCSKVDGTLAVQELNDLLSQGWTVNTTAETAVGDILIILDSPRPDSRQSQE